MVRSGTVVGIVTEPGMASPEGPCFRWETEQRGGLRGRDGSRSLFCTRVWGGFPTASSLHAESKGPPEPSGGPHDAIYLPRSCRNRENLSRCAACAWQSADPARGGA